MSISLGVLEKISARDVWQTEARDFTPWLAENLHLLADALGLDLELVQTEAPVGGYFCDIEARESGSGRCVIIENQLEQTDHTHLGQLLTYAAGLDAGVVVWISPNIRDEHREAIDFLNRHTKETVDFFAIALEVVKIEASPPAVIFRLAASPNEWTKTAAAAKNSVEATSREIAYKKFWQPLMDELRELHRFTKAKAAQPQSWYSFASGYSGINYGVAFSSGNSLRAEIYIDLGDQVKNKATFDFLENKKDEIEKLFGEKLKWERLEARRASRIAVILPDTNIDQALERGDEMRTWLIARLLKLKQIFGPHLRTATQFVPREQS